MLEVNPDFHQLFIGNQDNPVQVFILFLLNGDLGFPNFKENGN
jgi:hypothetical protein